MSGLPRSERGPFTLFYQPRREEFEQMVREEEGRGDTYLIPELATQIAEEEWMWMTDAEKQPFREAWMRSPLNHSKGLSNTLGMPRRPQEDVLGGGIAGNPFGPGWKDRDGSPAAENAQFAWRGCDVDAGCFAVFLEGGGAGPWHFDASCGFAVCPWALSSTIRPPWGCL